MSLTSSIPKRCPALGWGLLAGCVVLFFLSLSVGAAGYSLAELWTEKTILLYARLPRSLGCVLAGAALAGAGFLLQTVLNSLSSPSSLFQAIPTV
jgi:iron complex transport system permease protein